MRRLKSVDLRSILFPVLILGIGFLRYVLDRKLKIPFECIVSLLWIAFFYWWLHCTRRRFAQKRVRRYLFAFTLLVIFFMLLRMFKYEFCTPDGVVERYLWYLYYVPIVLIPVVTIRAIMNMNLPDNAVLARKHTWMYIAAAILIFGVLTNDLHQTAFIFPPGMPMRESEYTHGVLFYIISVWVVVGVLCVLFLSVRTCITRRMYKNLWIPLILLALGILYRYVYRFFDESGSNFLQVMYAIPEFYCMIWVLFWDSLVVTRLLPSNIGHSDFFSKSSMQAGLADRALSVRLTASNAITPTKEMFQAAQRNRNVYTEGDMLLRLCPVTGGWFYWTEDLRELRLLNEALEETEDYLQEENALMRQTARIEAERKHTLHQTALYESIEEKIRPQLDKLEELLWNMPEAEAEFRDALAQGAVIFAYLKRYSNLLLQTEAKKSISASELLLCIEESALSLKQMGVACDLDVQCSLVLSVETAAGLYALFEMALETELSSLTEISVCLQRKAKGICFVIIWKNGIAPPRNHILPYYAALRNAAEQIAPSTFHMCGATKTLSLIFGEEGAV